MKNHIYLAALAALLASCGIYNRYERPEVSLDGLYRQENVPDTTNSLARLHWEEVFTAPCCKTSFARGWSITAT